MSYALGHHEGVLRVSDSFTEQAGSVKIDMEVVRDSPVRQVNR